MVGSRVWRGSGHPGKLQVAKCFLRNSRDPLKKHFDPVS